MLNRRGFLGALGVPLVAAGVGFDPKQALGAMAAAGSRSADEVAHDENFWWDVGRAFTVDRSMVNLNNGGVSPAPAAVQESMARHLAFSNEAPSYKMWRILEPHKESVRQSLAREWDVDSEELAITRNASEGLQICQFGFDLKAGDEVLTTNQDYPRMITTFKQRAAREGIVLKQFSIPTPSEDDDEIVRLYEENITERTKLILVCHVINLTGQVLPVQRVVALGRKHGIPVIVDGAHAFAQLDFTLAELDCDYYATSLHKWLFAPIGTGLLYVRKSCIGDLWPLMAADESRRENIRKYEEIGTYPVANVLAIAEALSFHQGIGGANKQARMLMLRDYWAVPLQKHERIQLNTSLAPGMAGGIANVQIKGLDSSEVHKQLWKKHRIYTTVIKHDEFEGLRVSPSVYTSLPELDRFIDAMEDMVQNGLSS
ncbi:MAG: isopenicillin-N epimerase [Pseudohongiellaceae bacterium]|jgi:isopenicillin-N epimerase